jgi:hypothetical protein
MRLYFSNEHVFTDFFSPYQQWIECFNNAFAACTDPQYANYRQPVAASGAILNLICVQEVDGKLSSVIAMPDRITMLE